MTTVIDEEPGSDETPAFDREVGLRLFFSADLVSGTDFKEQHQPEYSSRIDDQTTWPSRFESFFNEFRDRFHAKVADARGPGATSILAPPELWKINGDEVLFTEFVYPDERYLYTAFVTSIRSFVGVVQHFDTTFLPQGMGVRGCVWTAGFPIRNRRVRIHPDEDIPLIPRNTEDFDTGKYVPEPAEVRDYIGREMDLGFRLAATVPPSRICCSLDVAWYLANAPRRTGLHVFHVGWRRLKGTIGGHPYPILWLETTREPRARHPWDKLDDEGTAETRALLSNTGVDEVRLKPKAIRTLAENMRQQLPAHLITPYASPSEIAESHLKVHSVQGLLPEVEVGRAHSDSAPPSSVSTISLDTLNHLQMLLRRDKEVAEALAVELHQIASHEAYGVWKAEDQLAGRLFRLPRDLISPADERRRVLEALRLVVGDVLRVKVNVSGSSVFISDGLWVPGEVRVYPFIDESDLLFQILGELGWLDSATCLVDPATGCGHNVLRYEGPVSRYGFDINARAIAYAAINTLINGVRDVGSLSINDVRTGIPPVFQQNEAEHVLVVANMPNALVPKPDTLPTSAEAGQYGHELTRVALDRIRELEAVLAGSSSVQCLALTYSVGRKNDDLWDVAQHAAEVFGSSRITWRLLEGEKLWRINGKKEQENPMPLENLELKADCKFYVRDEANRDDVRMGYRQLAKELHAQGWDHLGYGVVAVE